MPVKTKPDVRRWIIIATVIQNSCWKGTCEPITICKVLEICTNCATHTISLNRMILFTESKRILLSLFPQQFVLPPQRIWGFPHRFVLPFSSLVLRSGSPDPLWGIFHCFYLDQHWVRFIRIHSHCTNANSKTISLRDNTSALFTVLNAKTISSET